MEEVNTFEPDEGKPRICFATVTNEQFAVAAEVLLFSFINNNPWFDGDVVIIEAGELSPQTHDRLNAIYPIRFISGSEALIQRMSELEQAIPWLSSKRAHFHVFELFALTDYQHIVYIDGDTYCCGDISTLFYREEPLLACPDGFTLRTQLWKKLGEAAPDILPDVSPYGPQVTHSFNSGVMSINGTLISQQTFQGLLDLLTPEVFANSAFGDQMALNVYFNGEFKSISARYNYMVLVEQYIKGLEEITSLDACIVHFAGKLKPWFEIDYSELLEKAPHYLKFIDNWRELLQAARHQNNTSYIADQVIKQREWNKRLTSTLDMSNITQIL